MESAEDLVQIQPMLDGSACDNRYPHLVCEAGHLAAETSRSNVTCQHHSSPDRAMVPRLFTRSAFVMPMPESMMVSVLLALSGMMWMYSSGFDSRSDLSVSDWKRILSSASLELEISSRRKISLLE